MSQNTIAIITIVVLIAAIFIGYFRKANTGIICVAFAFFVGYFLVGMSPGDIYKGWPLQLFLRLVAVAMMFFMAKVNGTMEYVAEFLVRLVRGKNKLIPWVFFFANSILTALGPGPLPANSVMIPIALSYARREKMSDLMMGTMTASGALFGTLFPTSSTGVVAITLAEGVGVTDYPPIMMGLTIAALVEAAILYVVLKGFKTPDSQAVQGEKLGKMNLAQIETVIVIVLFIIGVLVLKYELLFMAFSGAALLLLLGAVNGDAAIKAVPWGTFIMLAGVSVMIGVVNTAGGIQLMSDSLARIMNENTAAPIMAVIGGLMSTVSSAVGVVMPTLIPTTAGIAASVDGVSTSALISAIIVGSHLSAYSPMSGMGGLIFANANEGTDKNKLFAQLILIAFASTVLAFLWGFVGLYR